MAKQSVCKIKHSFEEKNHLTHQNAVYKIKYGTSNFFTFYSAGVLLVINGGLFNGRFKLNARAVFIFRNIRPHDARCIYFVGKTSCTIIIMFYV